MPGADDALPTLPAFLEDEEDWPDDDGAGIDLDKLLEDDWDGEAIAVRASASWVAPGLRLASEAAVVYSPGMEQPSTIERAFELARSGECLSVDDIRRRLKDEQFDGIEQHLAGPSIKRQLSDLCRDARK